MSGDQTRATPAVRKLAASLGVDLGAVNGTGAGGRIRLADVRAAYEAACSPSGTSGAGTAGMPEPTGWFTGIALDGSVVAYDPRDREIRR